MNQNLARSEETDHDEHMSEWRYESRRKTTRGIPNISVGNRALDSNHMQMLDIVHRIQRSVRAKDYAAAAVDFRLLEDFARDCFLAEEKVARAVGFDFTHHNLAHQDMLKEFQQIGDKLADGNGSWPDGDRGEAYANFLNARLMEHLEYESRPLMAVLDKYLYDFNTV